MGHPALTYQPETTPLKLIYKREEKDLENPIPEFFGCYTKKREQAEPTINLYSFGMPMPGRSFNSGEYRYGFQGQEKDDELKGEGNSVNYKYRVHNPRLGRFFSIDPLAPDYPWNSPYAFSENRVIDGVELEGLEFQEIRGEDNVIPILVIPSSDKIPVPIQPGGLDYINNGGDGENIEYSPLDYLMDLINRGIIVYGNDDGSDSPGRKSSLPPAGSLDFSELEPIFSLLGIATKDKKANSLNKPATPERAAKIAYKYKDIGKVESSDGEDIIGSLRPDQKEIAEKQDSSKMEVYIVKDGGRTQGVRTIMVNLQDTADGKVVGSQYGEADGAEVLR
jgi:RHS repeat-associated protein